jgi:hypothetical protein
MLPNPVFLHHGNHLWKHNFFRILLLDQSIIQAFNLLILVDRIRTDRYAAYTQTILSNPHLSS